MRMKWGIWAVVAALVALLFLAWTPDISHDELAARYATSPSKFITLPSGTRAHYRERGPQDGPAIILLHGSAASLFTWEKWVPYFPQDARVISLDFPGHGLTGERPGGDYWIDGLTAFLKEFIDALDIDKVALVGNSMGGGISANFAIQFPQKVTGLVLIDADGLPEDAFEEIDGPVGFSIAHTPGVRWIATKVTPRFLVKQGLDNVSEKPGVVTEKAVDLYWDLLRHPGNRVAMIKRFKAAEERPMNHAFERITTPTLLLWGEKDRLIPLANGEAMAERIDGAKLIVYEGVGHLPQEEIPERSAIDTFTFLGSVYE